MATENTSLSSKNYVFLTCINPGYIFSFNMNIEITNKFEINRNFLEKIKQLNLDLKNSSFFVAVGPGSYTGIRQTIAFFMGILTVQDINIKTFNLFDFFETLMQNKLAEYDTIIINGFEKHDMDNFRGFAKDLRSGKFFYFNESVLPKNALWIDTPSSYFTDINITKVFKDTSFISKLNSKLEPLYINPVNITKPKAKKHK